MRTSLPLLLVFIASEVSSEETPSSNDIKTHSDIPPQILEQADGIYSLQKECDAYVGAAVVTTLETGNPFPAPDQKYLQCMKTLDEKKRDYINTALNGPSSYPKWFPMRLSDNRLVFLAVPGEIASEETTLQFDIQQKLCMTNKLCETIGAMEFSNEEDLREQQKHTARCLDFLNDSEIQYIEENRLYESGLKDNKGLIYCREGVVQLPIPEKLNIRDRGTVTNTIISETAKVNSDDTKDKNTVTANKVDTPNPENIPSFQSLRESNSKPETEKAVDQGAEQISREDRPQVKENSAVENEKDVSDIQNIVVSSSQQGQDTRTENGGIILENTEIKTTSDDVNDKRIEAFDNVHEEGNLIGLPNTSENTPQATTIETSGSLEETLTTPKDDVHVAIKGKASKEMKTSESTADQAENFTSSKGDVDVAIEGKASKNTKSRKEKDHKPKDPTNMELYSYRVKYVTKSGDGNEVKIQASGQIKKTETGVPARDQQKSPSPNKNPAKDSERNSDLEVFKQDYEPTKRNPESLEHNIILVENDCKEILNFGEQLLQHKILDSLVNLEYHYNECMKKLDTLKKMYIDKHRLDVTHKTIFPVTLPSGYRKLVPLPAQLLKTDIQGTQTSSSLTPEDTSPLVEFFRARDFPVITNWQRRKPFDLPAFITNDEFLESLKSEGSDKSSLSKVASLLHMKGHDEKKIVE